MWVGHLAQQGAGGRMGGALRAGAGRGAEGWGREEISLVGNEAQVVVLFLHKYTQHKYSPDPGCLQRQVLGGGGIPQHGLDITTGESSHCC